jgi:hypothetical protein
MQRKAAGIAKAQQTMTGRGNDVMVEQSSSREAGRGGAG